MPSPRAAIKLRMPYPRTDNVSKCPAVTGGGGGEWALLCIIKFIKSLWGIKRLNLHLKFYDTTR